MAPCHIFVQASGAAAGHWFASSFIKSCIGKDLEDFSADENFFLKLLYARGRRHNHNSRRLQ